MKQILFLLCTTLFLLSCKKEETLPPRTINVISDKTVDTSRFKAGPYHFTITPGSSNKSYSSTAINNVRRVFYQLGDMEIMIIEDHLYIDYFDFGTIEEDDSIFVDSTIVSVNKTKREGKELTLDEAQKIAPSPKTIKTLNGHTIEFIPGVSSYLSNNREHILKAGHYKIEIKNNQLVINSKRYGKIRKGDPVSIQLGRVYVSGKLRRPQ